MVTPPPGTLIKDDSPQCRINEVISPVKSWMPDGDSVIFDFGKNMTGFVEITTAGKAGVKIAITYSELLASNNDLSRDNVACYIVDGDKAQTDIFIHDGSDNFVWHPRFVYHGFRYVKVLAYGDARVTNIKACYVHTGFAPAGTAEISNKIKKFLTAPATAILPILPGSRQIARTGKKTGGRAMRNLPVKPDYGFTTGRKTMIIFSKFWQMDNAPPDNFPASPPMPAGDTTGDQGLFGI